MNAAHGIAVSPGQPPTSRPQKFSGDGWYAFHNPRAPGTGVRVFWCSRDAEGDVNASDARDLPGAFRLSPAAFDYACFGQVHTVEEAEAEVALLRQLGRIR